MQDYPNYKYRPRRKKRDGQKGGGGAAAGNNNNKTNSNNNNLSNGAVAGAGADKEEEEAKYEVGVASSETPPLYEVGGGVAGGGGGAVGRSFTIPTPESSPSSCTSDAFHGQAVVGYQPITSSAPPINIEGELTWLQLVFETHLYPVTRIPVLMTNDTVSHPPVFRTAAAAVRAAHARGVAAGGRAPVPG